MGLSNDLFVDPVPVVNGMITAPERPGHGLAFKPEILKDCKVVMQHVDPSRVMAGLVPAIHAEAMTIVRSTCTASWMPGTSPGMTNDRLDA